MLKIALGFAKGPGNPNILLLNRIIANEHNRFADFPGRVGFHLNPQNKVDLILEQLDWTREEEILKKDRSRFYYGSMINTTDGTPLSSFDFIDVQIQENEDDEYYEDEYEDYEEEDE